MAAVPSLSGTTFIKDPQSIIAYTLNLFMRMPRDTVPLMDDHLISLPWLAAQHAREPETLVIKIQNDLQRVFSRIFADERAVTVSCNYTLNGDDTYDVTMSIIYTQISGDIGQLGTTISLDKNTGRLVIPENDLARIFG